MGWVDTKQQRLLGSKRCFARRCFRSCSRPAPARHRHIPHRLHHRVIASPTRKQHLCRHEWEHGPWKWHGCCWALTCVAVIVPASWIRSLPL
eukprot:77028-Rhodomonas_salina.1